MKNKLMLPILFISCTLVAQINFNANQIVQPYTGVFYPAVNTGAITAFNDIQLATLAAGIDTLPATGIGAKALRPLISEDYLENYGYNSLLPTFQAYSDLGLGEHTCIIGYPSEAHRDTTHYCPEHQSVMFANLYEPIWDGGLNGTPVNEQNYLAIYVYRMVQTYGNHIKFWEVWNEPGFDYTGNRGYLLPGSPGNWWENNPDPCDYKLRAPIFHYIRTLRICYEVIKYLEPNDYVVLSGTGFPSFLDAVLRNTDNPLDGSIESTYPEKGGAYFDVMGFHSYPHFDGAVREWSNELNDWRYFRHSDKAADGLMRSRLIYQEVLDNYGYEGNLYPQKLWTITEGNIPRKSFDEYIGSDSAQQNFIAKAFISCVKNDFLQYHLYTLSEEQLYNNATHEFGVMGAYEKLLPYNGLRQTRTPEGIAYKTCTELLFGYKYNAARTEVLALPNTVDGGVFEDANNNSIIVLWAKTHTDRSESVSVSYQLPAAFTTSNFLKYNIDYGTTHSYEIMQGNVILTLSASPIFLKQSSFLNEYFSDDVCTNFPVQLNAINQQTGYTYFWEFENAVPVTSTINNPVVNFTTIGNHIVQLTVRDAQNNIISHEVQTYNVHEPPVADFNFNQNGALVNFQNTSSSFVNSFNWYFGDGYTSNLENPNHFYMEAGQFQVILLAEGLCGTSTKIDTLTIQNTQIPQIDSTALEYVPPIATPFRYGANFSFYPPWSDEQLADIAAGNTLAQIEGVGVNALRTLLPHFFLDGFGYDIRASTFQHYHNLDIQGNTAILGYPVAEVRDTQYYCPTNQSVLFKNIYTNIWDDGSNATPYNDQNEFAKYIYETVKVYKDHVTYWQILPSPDFDEGSQKGGLVVGQYGNWYENNPDPCDYNLHAPIFYYIRMLRVAYEIIKTISPDDYVMIGGIGHASFIDAILRNTDNPLDGSVATAFPNKGGAYFDAIGLNIYPNYDGSVKYYDVNAGGIVYRRHSDAAADGMEAAKNRFETVLEQRGFDGVIHPKKIYTISECNIPRKKIEDELGGEQPQRNYIIKALVKAQKEGFSKLDVFALAETDFIEETNIPKNIMGLYQRIIDLPPYSRNYTNAGIAFYTTSKLLYGTTYDSLKTAQMNLPSNVEGAAFKDANGNFIYALWAKTTIDEAEVASATYSFPMSFGLSDLKMYRWDFATTDSIIQLSPNAIVLDAIPIFLSPSPTIITPPLASFEIQTNAVGCAGYEITFLNTSLNANSVVWHFEGGVPTISTMLNPTVVYPNEGVFDVSITAYNAAGEHTFTLNDVITINEIPQANYSFVVDDRTAFFNNISVQADSFYWDFGDGNNSFAFFPEHYYFEDGVFTVMLVAFNECGSDTTYQNVFIHTAPEANFSFQANSFCAPATLSFTDNSSANVTQRQWILLGANPVSSNEISFTANFLQAGIFPVTLIVANEYGSDTITQSITITSEITHSITDTLCGDEFIIVNGTVYNGEHLSGTETIFGGGGSGCDSIIQVNLTQEIQLIISITDTISPGEVYIYGDSVFTQPGSYSFYIDNPNSPCDQLVHLLLIASVAITEVDNKDIRIYPNPFLQQVFVEPLATNMEVKYIQIFNILGQPVSCKFSNNRAHLIVDTENIPTGVYQLLLDTSEGVYRTTIVKQ